VAMCSYTVGPGFHALLQSPPRSSIASDSCLSRRHSALWLVGACDRAVNSLVRSIASNLAGFRKEERRA